MSERTRSTKADKVQSSEPAIKGAAITSACGDVSATVEKQTSPQRSPTIEIATPETLVAEASAPAPLASLAPPVPAPALIPEDLIDYDDDNDDDVSTPTSPTDS